MSISSCGDPGLQETCGSGSQGFPAPTISHHLASGLPAVHREHVVVFSLPPGSRQLLTPSPEPGPRGLRRELGRMLVCRPAPTGATPACGSGRSAGAGAEEGALYSGSVGAVVQALKVNGNDI